MRAVTVLVAYVTAIVAGVFIYGFVGALVYGSQFAGFWKFLTVYLPMASVILAFNYWLTPYAAAGLLASEILSIERWWGYPIGGAALGVMICAQRLPHEVERAPFFDMLPYYLSVMSGAILASLIYWLIAWRKWPPVSRGNSIEEKAQ